MPVIQFEPRPKKPIKPPRKTISSGVYVAVGFIVIAVVAFAWFYVTGPG